MLHYIRQTTLHYITLHSSVHYIHTCMPLCINMYIIYIDKHIHICIKTYWRSYMHTYIHTCMVECLEPFEARTFPIASLLRHLATWLSQKYRHLRSQDVASSSLWRFSDTHTYGYVYIYIYIYIYEHIHCQTYAFTDIHILTTYKHAHVQAYIHACIHTYARTYVPIYIHTLHYIRVQYRTVSCSTVQYNKEHYSTVHYVTHTQM